jgi:(1->4)-alpha-D-glucan 1-alpha-D-glucosylmutase
MRLPCATYRLQFNQALTFQDARRLLGYLADLGISDIYASPIFKARTGSSHGYNIVDPNQINPELGDRKDFEELTGELKQYDMGWIQDFIPNHMAYDYQNRMLMDVLENGPNSEYFRFFDVEWDHPYEGLRGKIVAPFLGGFYGESLEKGEIQLRYDEDGLTVSYYDLRLPLAIESYEEVSTHVSKTLEQALVTNHPDRVRFFNTLSALKELPPGDKVHERYRLIGSIKRRLWEFYTQSDEIRGFVDAALRHFNGTPGNPESFNPLDQLLSEQRFRLSFWKVATEEINYRRFFNINELICLRVEDKDVFDHIHSLLFQLIGAGRISGLRIDHIDGLYDPAGYLEGLRARAGEQYICVEKILDLSEELPPGWPVQGTTGYDFMNYVNGIFCRKNNEKAFDRLYTQFTGLRTAYPDLTAEKKRLIMGKHMAGDVDNLAHFIKRISDRYRYGRDITLYGLKRALVEIMVLFPVYRTYVDGRRYSARDRSYIKETIRRAARSNPGLQYELNIIEQILLLEWDESLTEEERGQWVHLVMRFQQFTGPLMAKGFEDTVLYNYNRLLSLNEVGGDPGTFGIPVQVFHAFLHQRSEQWPHTLNATSTHDTKRGEDVRARINVLSEIPAEWRGKLRQWSRINRKKKRKLNNSPIPDRNDEYALYQTLIGAFPFDEDDYPAFVERIKEYIIKAIREAKVHTAWLKPDTAYEEAFIAFVESILQPSEGNPFLEAFVPFQQKTAFYGIFNSLSQTLVKITAPGVPDFYQGTELWDLSLVDPDNRRPIDFDRRRAMLENIKEGMKKDLPALIARLWATKGDGGVKLFLIHRALAVRRERSDIFQTGPYIPLATAGRWREHVIAFARKGEKAWALTIAPRFLTALIPEGTMPLGQEVWADTAVHLPADAPAVWQDAITNLEVAAAEKTIVLGEALTQFPVALLISEEEP